MRKIYFTLSIIILFVVACKKDIESDNSIVSPSPFALFRITDLPSIELNLSEDQWNKLLINYDSNSMNDQKVIANFKYILNGTTINLDSCGLRLRGNSSRRRPSGNTGELFNSNQPNWHHCHFGLDFAKEKGNQRFAGKRKLNLKWFKDDANYVREIYSYDLFKRYGVWTAPKASYCRLTIRVEGTTAYYGVYAMIESVDEDFITSRMSNFGGSIGYLWKCGWAGSNNADFVSSSSIGVEEVYLNASLSKYYSYDLKNRESELSTAKTELQNFIHDLNTKTDTDFQNWISQKMDIDLFLKTIAVNVMVGMWDDYWVNANNFYFYFSPDGKAWFIPYDYDNTLGTSLLISNAGTQNPIQWGKVNNRPLINKILSIPEFQIKYMSYLKELSDPTKDLFHADKSINRIKNWQNFIGPYVSNDTGEDMLIEDFPASWGNADYYRLLSGNDLGGTSGYANFFSTKCKSIWW